MGYAMVSGGKPDMAAPVTGILLSSIAEGSIVKLNENGSPVEFYVAKHDYESALNGEGRTLLIRKDTYDIRSWNSANNAYAMSDIDSWLNDEYKSILDHDVQDAISTTKFYYTLGNGNETITTLERSVFLPSSKEMNKTSAFTNSEGNAFPAYSVFRNSDRTYWTRTPVLYDANAGATSTTLVVGILTNGNFGYYLCSGTFSSRPVFTLPATAYFDETTLIFKGVA